MGKLPMVKKFGNGEDNNLQAYSNSALLGVVKFA